MIRCWVTHQQTGSKNCEFVTTSGSNTWPFYVGCEFLGHDFHERDCNLTIRQNCLASKLAFICKNNHTSNYFFRIKRKYQNHNYCTWMHIWYLWASTLSFSSTLISKIWAARQQDYHDFWDQLSPWNMQALPFCWGILNPRKSIKPTINLRIVWSPQNGLMTPDHHPPKDLFGDLKKKRRLFHTLQTDQASQLLQQRLQPLERFVHAKKARESGKFWRSFTEGPLGCSCLIFLVPGLVGISGMFVERTKTRTTHYLHFKTY